MRIRQKIVIIVITIAVTFAIYNNCNAKTVTVTTDTLKLRKEPNTECTVLELVSEGDKLEYIEETGNWCKVVYNGITGYVSKDYVTIEGEQQKPATNTVENNTGQTNTVTTNNVVTNTVTQENNTVSTNEVVNNQEGNTANETNTIENNEQTTKEDTQIKVQEYVAKQMQIKEEVDTYILPLINCCKVGKVTKGTKVMVINETNGWAYIQTNEINAWVRTNLLEEISQQSVNPSQTDDKPPQTTQSNPPDMSTNYKEKQMYVNESSIYVRSGPGTNYQDVDSLILNAEVTVIGETGDWYNVKIDGKTGYIAKWLLSDKKQEISSRGDIDRTKDKENKEEQGEQSAQNQKEQEVKNTTNSKGQEIVNYAKQYLGCKYVYGGSGPKTFDCSGFTMYVYKNFGISLSHSATAQSKKGTYVAKENLQPGDLVFFKDYETMKGIGHCGIYIGEGNFIHASSGAGYCVKTSTLLSGSYLNRYETARRLI